MENKQITITISGEVSSGKSRLTYLLKNFLRVHGFEVKHDGGIDFEDEKDFDDKIIKNLDVVLKNIKENKTIKIQELNINRQ